MSGAADPLGLWLGQAEGMAFKPGVHDCCLFVADWVRIRLGVDPAARWRGTYGSDRETGAILAREAGVLGVMSRAARRCALEPTAAPGRGDVGVITEPGSGQDIGAICTGPRWAALSRRGLIVVPAAPRAAWRIA